MVISVHVLLPRVVVGHILGVQRYMLTPSSGWVIFFKYIPIGILYNKYCEIKIFCALMKGALFCNTKCHRITTAV
jgi:hypothetical protein